jgi:glycerol-3-phosphate dehydrogenase
MAPRPYDIAVIGGGINGAGIARDAAGRGLSVVLVEQADLSNGTSSVSTKLIHGGLRYLERYEFRLVRDALREREVLMRAAPHIIRPMRFVLPHHAGLRPWWMLRLGLFVYDHLGGRRILPGTRIVNLRQDAAGEPLKPEFVNAFEYSDCCVDDARLVVDNAVDAAERGADIRVRTRCGTAERRQDTWRLMLEDRSLGVTSEIEARALVNAAGPWILHPLAGGVRPEEAAHMRLVQGSHIVVRKLFDHDRSYIFQNSDGRVCFVIPYEGDFTLIGTTDRDYEGDPGDVVITRGEIEYLCAAASAYLRRPVQPSDVVWSYSGVRPLYDGRAAKAQEATRDYVLKIDAPNGAAPLLKVFGGKITTYRKLAEDGLAMLAPHFPGLGGSWTAGARLPGGDMAWNGTDDVAQGLATAFPFLPDGHVRRLVRTYGTRTHQILANARSASDLGQHFGWDLTEREVQYLMNKEWAYTAEDVLWRRTKLGLRVTSMEAARLEAWMADNRKKAGETRSGMMASG